MAYTEINFIDQDKCNCGTCFVGVVSVSIPDDMIKAARLLVDKLLALLVPTNTNN